jgi:hypothetical protein
MLCRLARLVGLVAVACLSGAAQALAQSEAPGSRGENFSAKPAPQLFTSDCTGGGCHKGPQGLAKGQSQTSLAGFLREHYTNSRESAAALSRYLVGLANAPAPAEPRAARTAPGARSSRAAARSDEQEAATPAPRTPPAPRPPRGRQATAAPPPPPTPPEPPAPPPPKQFDIFD